jgi:hypothetical protein
MEEDKSMAPRLAHGWQLAHPPGLSRELLQEYVRPAIRAVPRAMATRLGVCEIFLTPRLRDGDLSSEWTETKKGLQITVATEDVDAHDLAMELLLCLGEALWDRAKPEEVNAYLRLLRAELDAGVSGEIDEDALHEKQLLLSSPILAGSRRRLGRYARASFAGTAAEFIHCLWHDVTIRTGPEHLPVAPLRTRLEMLAAWFPPDRGYSLFG